MQKLIAERVERTEAFLLDLAKLEEKYTTIGTTDTKWRQEVHKEDLIEARKAW